MKKEIFKSTSFLPNLFLKQYGPVKSTLQQQKKKNSLDFQKKWGLKTKLEIPWPKFRGTQKILLRSIQFNPKEIFNQFEINILCSLLII